MSNKGEVVGIEIQAWRDGAAHFMVYEHLVGWRDSVGGEIDALRNVAESVIRNTEVTKRYNGKGRSATYATDVDAIAQSGRQLAEMVLALLNGQPPASVNDDSPF